MNKLDQYKIEELKNIQELLMSFKTIEEAIKTIENKIFQKEEEQKKSINIRFNLELMEKLQILEPSELKLVKEQGIKNLQELLELDLDSIPNISISTKKSIEEKRRFYDMSTFEEKKHNKKR
ncbi:MAG: hypothetical protein IJG68_01200 [Bacilli bacterium]|nr:hypothetical protein [Bacilli bacterium]